MSENTEIIVLLQNRGRVDSVARFLDSVTVTADRPDRLEVVLYLDADDQASHDANHDGLRIVKLIRPAVRMGEMQRACFHASRGRYIMLMNDDAVCRTQGWDTAILAEFDRFPDGVALAWCNDLCLGPRMANFPCISRGVCELMGEPCPADFSHDYVDTHIFDTFHKLRAAGHDRLAYLPQVIIEHLHHEAGKAAFDLTYVKPRRQGDELAFIAWDEQRQALADALAARSNGKPPCDS